jgi:hypothetical protein
MSFYFNAILKINNQAASIRSEYFDLHLLLTKK